MYLGGAASLFHGAHAPNDSHPGWGGLIRELLADPNLHSWSTCEFPGHFRGRDQQPGNDFRDSSLYMRQEL